MKTTLFSLAKKNYFFEMRRVFEVGSGITIDRQQHPKESKELPEEVQRRRELQKMIEGENFGNMSEADFLKKLPNGEQRFFALNKQGLRLSDIQEGKEFNITFHNNEKLEQRITAGEIFPPSIRKITVQSPGKNPAEITGIRNGVSGEFFATNGQRVKIYEDSHVTINKAAAPEEIAQMQKAVAKSVAGFPTEDQAAAQFSSEKGIDPKLAVELLRGKNQEEMEMLLTEIARKEGNFSEQFPELKVRKNGRYTAEFLGFTLNTQKDTLNKVLDSGDYTNTEKESARGFWKNRIGKLVNVRMEASDFKEIREGCNEHLAQYPPGSIEAIRLFRKASARANVPEEWALSSALHEIMRRESKGYVGRPNYEFSDNRRSNPPRSEWQAIQNAVKNNPQKDHKVVYKGRPILSSATGLGQLIQTNVDVDYPSGRNGIGVPLEEAAGMMTYIKRVYKTPENALACYESGKGY